MGAGAREEDSSLGFFVSTVPERVRRSVEISGEVAVAGFSPPELGFAIVCRMVKYGVAEDREGFESGFRAAAVGGRADATDAFLVSSMGATVGSCGVVCHGDEVKLLAAGLGALRSFDDGIVGVTSCWPCCCCLRSRCDNFALKEPFALSSRACCAVRPKDKLDVRKDDVCAMISFISSLRDCNGTTPHGRVVSSESSIILVGFKERLGEPQAASRSVASPINFASGVAASS